MKLKSIVYWTTTVLTAASMATSAGLYFSHNKQMKKQFESLRLPNYLSGVLGTANVLGVAALLARRRSLLKEWAYSGFTFTFLGAAAAHLATKQNKAALAPLISSCTRSFVSDASIRSQILQGHSDLRAVSQPSCQIFGRISFYNPLTTKNHEQTLHYFATCPSDSGGQS